MLSRYSLIALALFALAGCTRVSTILGPMQRDSPGRRDKMSMTSTP